MKNENIKSDFRGPKALVLISWFFLTAFILFKLSVYPISQFNFETVFILIFLGGIFFRPWQLKSDIAIRLIVLSVFFPLIFFATNYITDSSLAMQYFSIEKLVKLMLFSVIGFWLGGKLRNIYIFLGLVFLGLLVALFNVDTFLAFKDIFNGKRVNFNIKNAQHTAMFFGLAVIGFISFYKELFFFLENKKLKIEVMVLFSTALLLVVIVFVGTKTRAALLGMDFIFILSIIHFLMLYKKHRMSKKVVYLFCAYALLSSILLSICTINTLNSRGFESDVTKELLNKDLENIPMTSLGIRVNTWIEASKWIKQKPLHGWGGKVRKQVIQQSNFSDHIKKHFGHFHNSYIEFTLAYGLIGLAFILFIYSWVNRQTYLLAKENTKYHGIWLFTLYGSLYLMIINIFESYVFFGTGVYATAFLLAPGYSLYLSKLYRLNKTSV